MVGVAGKQAFNVLSVPLAQSAIFRRGDILANVTTGTIAFPNPNGSIATVAPTAAVTIGSTTASGTPRQVLYGYYTYAGAGSIESLTSAEFNITNSSGNNATVTVPSAGAPAAATSWTLYVGLIEGGEWQQVTGTSLGSAATVPYPLTNSVGANRAATNASGNILGIALDDYDVNYTDPNWRFSNRAPFGADSSGPPMEALEQYMAKVYTLGGNQPFDMSVVQAYPIASGATGGLLYSTTYNAFAFDTSQSNKILTYRLKVSGPTNPTYDSVGTAGDTGWRGQFYFNSGLVL
jgi:hypothetical protein